MRLNDISDEELYLLTKHFKFGLLFETKVNFIDKKHFIVTLDTIIRAITSFANFDFLLLKILLEQLSQKSSFFTSSSVLLFSVFLRPLVAILLFSYISDSGGR